jgi:hypothetical protein
LHKDVKEMKTLLLHGRRLPAEVDEADDEGDRSVRRRTRRRDTSSNSSLDSGSQSLQRSTRLESKGLSAPKEQNTGQKPRPAEVNKLNVCTW